MKTKQETPWGDFCVLMGATPRNRILEFFLDLRTLEFTTNDVALETGLNRATTYNAMEELTAQGYLIPTRKASGSQLYKLNKQNPEVKMLIQISEIILDKIVEEYTEQEETKEPMVIKQ